MSPIPCIRDLSETVCCSADFCRMLTLSNNKYLAKIDNTCCVSFKLAYTSFLLNKNLIKAEENPTIVCSPLASLHVNSTQ